LEVGISITLAQLLVAERDSRIADAVLVDARKKLRACGAGCRQGGCIRPADRLSDEEPSQAVKRQLRSIAPARRSAL
jgi:hypothetical protein